MARLENWTIFNLGIGTGEYLVGEVYDDSKGRFEDGKTIMTSLIQELNLEEGYAITRSTKYILGKPLE